MNRTSFYHSHTTLLSVTLPTAEDTSILAGSTLVSQKEPKHQLDNNSPASHGCYSQVKQHIVLWTDTQVLPDGAELGADVFAQDEGSTRGWREQASQDGPEEQTKQICRFYH